MREFTFVSISILSALLSLVGIAAGEEGERGAPWQCHIIDESSRGADGVKLFDADGDGLLDIATGWEEGGITRIYRNPGPAQVKNNWSAVTLGKTPQVEDAAWIDLERLHTRKAVVSCCEGKTRFHHRKRGMLEK